LARRLIRLDARSRDQHRGSTGSLVLRRSVWRPRFPPRWHEPAQPSANATAAAKDPPRTRPRRRHPRQPQRGKPRLESPLKLS